MTEDTRPLTRGELVIAAAMLLYVGTQIGIPLTQLRATYHTPLAWKMFAYIGPRPVSIRVVYADGRTEDLGGIQKRLRVGRTLRPEIDRARVVPPALCAQVPSIAAVEFRHRPDMRWETFPCP